MLFTNTFSKRFHNNNALLKRISKAAFLLGFLPASSSHGLHISVYIYIRLLSLCWSNANCSNNWPIMPQNTSERYGEMEQDGECAVGRLISSATPTPAPLRPLSHNRRKRRKPFNAVLSYLKVGIRCAYTKPNMVMKWAKRAEKGLMCLNPEGGGRSRSPGSRLHWILRSLISRHCKLMPNQILLNYKPVGRSVVEMPKCRAEYAVGPREAREASSALVVVGN